MSLHVKHIPQMMREFKTPYIKVFDRSGNKLFEIIEKDKATVENSVKKFETMIKMFSQYDTLEVWAINKLSSNFTGCFKWDVTTKGESNESEKNPVGASSPGSDYKQILALELQIISLKNKAEIDNLRRDFEDKTSNRKKDLIEQIADNLPLIGMGLGWDQNKIDKIVALQGMRGNLSGGYKQPNANSNTPPPEVETVKAIEQVLEEISNKVDLKKILTLLQAIDKNPAIVDQALTFLKS